MVASAPRIVILGAGFGGLRCAKALAGTPVQVTVIDRSNHHLFQPLLYQVATATLSPADIASPIRSILRSPNTEVRMAEIVGIDKGQREVWVERPLPGPPERIAYDTLVVATGARHSYFGHKEWEAFAPGLKSIPDATAIRQKVLYAFEQAEIERDSKRQEELLHFVLVGAGPTGVEMAGACAELSHILLAKDFRRLRPGAACITLIEAGPRILASFPEDLSRKAEADLKRLGVTVRTSARVEKITAEGVLVGSEWLRSRTVIWTAGVVASPAGKWLGAETDRFGRVRVGSDLSLPGHAEIFVIGDTAAVVGPNGKTLPGVAPVAMQQGLYVARAIQSRLEGRSVSPFSYKDKGNLATIGKSAAVADLGRLHLSGPIAWAAWLLVHIYYLIGFRNRILVLLEWAWRTSSPSGELGLLPDSRQSRPCEFFKNTSDPFQGSLRI